MCTHARTPSPSRATEIASSKSFAVSGSIVNVVRSRRSMRPSSVARRRLVRLELLPRAALDEQPLEHVLDPARPARARARPARGRGRSRRRRARPRSASPSPLRSSDDRRPRREVRLADDELPAPRDLDDGADGFQARPGGSGAASAPEPATPSSSPTPSRISAFSANGIACASVRVLDVEDQRQRPPPCRAQQDHRERARRRGRRAAPRP